MKLKENEHGLAKSNTKTDKNVSEKKPNYRRFRNFKTLAEFGYHFDSNGQLKSIDTGKPFIFDTFPEKEENQARYEALGEIINDHVYGLLETKASLKRLYIPIDNKPNEPTGFVFISRDFYSNSKLLILIHGSGVVRAGQWARRLIVNDSIDSGTQLPYILKAQEEGFAILVLNTNLNSVKKDDTNTEIRGSASAIDHGLYIWKNLVLKKDFQNVMIVAHSYGGVVTVRIAAKFSDDWLKIVKAVALTDSVHNDLHIKNNKKLLSWFKKNTRNWVSSSETLDTKISGYGSVIPCVSAGHIKHENTSWSAFTSVFKFLGETEQRGMESHEEPKKTCTQA